MKTNKKYWLRGGLVVQVYYVLVNAFYFYWYTLNPSSAAEPTHSVPIIVDVLSLPVKPVIVLEFLFTYAAGYIGYACVFIVFLIVYTLIGSLFGLLYGKFINRNKL